MLKSRGGGMHQSLLSLETGDFTQGLITWRISARAEILLRLHGQFQPGRKTPISVRKFTEVKKHN